MGNGPSLIVTGALTLLSFAGPANGENELAPPALPGLGAYDPRVRADPNAVPWRAVGKLQATSGGLHESCTGTLIGPAMVLTAAHCVFNVRTQHNFLPQSLHFLIGYNGDDYVGHAVGIKLATGPGYDPLKPHQTIGSDWALLTLDAKLGAPDRTLALRDKPPSPGTAVTIGGYGQDHPLVLMVDPECRIVGQATDASKRPLLIDDCAATRGASGAPVLVADGKNWSVGGIYVAAAMGAPSGVVVPLGDVRAQLGRAKTPGPFSPP